MRADWQEIPRGDVMPQYAGLYATMNPMGRIVMNRITYDKLGSPEAFVILYDRNNNRIGLKPAHGIVKNAYPALVSNNAGAKMVRAFRLLREHNIELPHTVQFCDADISDDGILILDLRTAKLSPRASAHKRRKPSDAS